MMVKIHPHARERMAERGASEEDILSAISKGERFMAKFNRVGFRRNFSFQNKWKDRYYQIKQLEVYGVEEIAEIHLACWERL